MKKLLFLLLVSVAHIQSMETPPAFSDNPYEEQAWHLKSEIRIKKHAHYQLMRECFNECPKHNTYSWGETIFNPFWVSDCKKMHEEIQLSMAELKELYAQRKDLKKRAKNSE